MCDEVLNLKNLMAYLFIQYAICSLIWSYVLLMHECSLLHQTAKCCDYKILTCRISAICQLAVYLVRTSSSRMRSSLADIFTKPVIYLKQKSYIKAHRNIKNNKILIVKPLTVFLNASSLPLKLVTVNHGQSVGQFKHIFLVSHVGIKSDMNEITMVRFYEDWASMTQQMQE